ncbi:MAG: T9SS type A sorting domain-containing protein [bacterium]|nr:T9SS type A sorting domain-containing protein [bacterium]
MKKLLVLLVVLSFCAVSGFAGDSPYRPEINYPVLAGDEVVEAPTAYPPYPELPARDVVGDTMTIGTTWYDIQHNGTVGRMLAEDEFGNMHFAWMNGLNSGASSRHIYYNYVTAGGTQGWPYFGTPVESSIKAGYTTMDVDHGGLAFPTFHEQTGSSPNYHTAVGADFFPLGGAFLVTEPPWLFIGGLEQEIIWPKCMFDRNQRFHIVSTENPLSGVAGDPQRVFYTYGTYDPLTYIMEYPASPTWTELTWTMTIAPDVAASDVSDRVAFGWTYCKDAGFPVPPYSYSQLNNDIHILIDDDGIDPDPLQAFNLTDFIPPDLTWLPDTTLANMDTLRAYTDMNLFFDQDDYLHVVFSTRSFFELEGTSYWHPSIVWHWSEQYPDDFSMVHNAFDDWSWNFIDCGAWNLKAQRPSLGQDPATGHLYCMYQVFDVDTTAISAQGWPSGEIYVSVSTDGGLSWAEGTNITQTVTPNNAPAGACLSEITPSMAKTVDGNCHILYVLDKDAGTVVQTEGTWTYNQVIYHKVPVGLIPTTPLVPQNVPFHVEHYGGTPTFVVNLDYVSGSPVPPGGGNVNFDVYVLNASGSSQNFDAWLDAEYEGGSPTTLVMRSFINYQAGWTINRPNMFYPVPGAWPAGNYMMYARVGNHPNTIWEEDGFAFAKSGDDHVANFQPFPVAGAPDPFDRIDKGGAALPTEFIMHGNYPNPFNPTTQFSFAIPQADHVTLKVFNLQGQLVETLVDGLRDAGSHNVTFDATALSSGIYLYQLTAGSNIASGKMVLVK